jgi:hypothetical protein
MNVITLDFANEMGDDSDSDEDVKKHQAKIESKN